MSHSYTVLITTVYIVMIVPTKTTFQSTNKESNLAGHPQKWYVYNHSIANVATI